jgi:RNA polymerase sigma factor (sigma-70 family)
VPRNDPSAAVPASRAAAGDRDAWEEIVERYAPLIWSICRRHGLARADAEDVAEKVWLQLVDQLGCLRDPAALPGWLAAVTRRECLRMLTGRGSERPDTKLADSPQSADDDEQEPLEELFVTVFELAGEIASRISQDQVEARLRRALQEAGYRQEEEPAPKAARQGGAGAAPHDDPAAAVPVSRAAAGGQDAWDEIVERYAPLIWSICRGHGLDGTDAGDVEQKVWLRLVDQLGSVHDPAGLHDWLTAATHNECRHMLAGRGSERPDTRQADSPQSAHDADDMVIDEEILVAERNAALRAAFAELPLRDQRLLSMLISDPPHSYAEISAELGIPVGRIGSEQARCLDRLRRHPAIAALIAETGADLRGGEPGRHGWTEAG